VSTPDAAAHLAGEAQDAARDAAARTILHAQAWASAAATGSLLLADLGVVVSLPALLEG
jgi:hypothetical protein